MKSKAKLVDTVIKHVKKCISDMHDKKKYRLHIYNFFIFPLTVSEIHNPIMCCMLITKYRSFIIEFGHDITMAYKLLKRHYFTKNEHPI